jgi:hypothetical protein
MINYGDKSPKSPSLSHSRNVCTSLSLYLPRCHLHIPTVVPHPSQQFLNLLQTHYPERLGRAVVINVPFFLNAFYKLITPFIDPATRTKIRFNPKLVDEGLFAADNLFTDFGGSVELVYEHEVYFPALVEMTDGIRARRMEAWRALGAKVGIKEWDVKTWIPPAPGGDDATDKA